MTPTRTSRSRAARKGWRTRRANSLKTGSADYCCDYSVSAGGVRGSLPRVDPVKLAFYQCARKGLCPGIDPDTILND